MKTKYPSMFGVLAALLLVASFVIPINLASPSAVQADPGICKWDTLLTPGYMPFKFDVVGPAYGGNDIHDMAVGGDGATIVLVVQAFGPPILPIMPDTGFLKNILFYSNNNGITFSIMAAAFMDQWRDFHNIPKATWQPTDAQWPNVWLIAIAPDNPKFWAVVSDGWDTPTMTLNPYPTEVWITTNAGAKWQCTNFEDYLTTIGEPNELIRCIDVSVDYGGKRDIAVGTEDAATGAGDVYVVSSAGFGGWSLQDFDAAAATTPPTPIVVGTPLGDFFAVKFSPTYPSDASLAMVYANATATYYNVALRDVDSNVTNQLAFGVPGIEVKDPNSTAGDSPSATTLNKADLELPSDFSGQAASLRRAYVSTDAYTGNAKSIHDQDGIFRIDDGVVYELMDTSNIVAKSIYSIAYFGTYASGKMLAGERMGFPCTAQVPTWFTDSPTTCPIPCWYPALKPTTGAADNVCSNTQSGIGAALVGWRADGQVAFVATGSHAIVSGANWYIPWLPVEPPAGWSIIMNDESAFGISRNNGETWNQTSLIDTTIDKFTDVAPSPDCNTVYLASVNYGLSTVSCPVSVSANVTCYGNPHDSHYQTCSVAWLNNAAAACGNLLGETKSSTCSYNVADCTCSYSLTDVAVFHCACSTCATCNVTVTLHDTGTIHAADNVTVSETVTLLGTLSCTGQPGCGQADECSGFDSVWRTSQNPDVVAPYPPIPLGIFWERVLTRVTAPTCWDEQQNFALLRLVPYCADPTGEIVAWAVFDGNESPLGPSTYDNGVAAWSPDYGDYWANITVRDPIQDFCFESRTVMYFLSPIGQVQKMPYTGTAWATTLSSVDSMMYYAHTIAAYPEGKVLCGAGHGFHSMLYASSFCGNFNTDNPAFDMMALAGGTDARGSVHVAFDPNFKDNDTIFIADDDATVGNGLGGSVYRNISAGIFRWADMNMMAATNGAVGCDAPHEVGQYGLVLAFTGQALYSAHTDRMDVQGLPNVDCGVDRTIDDGTGKYGPLSGMPKPGIAWDCLDVFVSGSPCFTLEPSSLKICGCCTMDSDSTLYAIDNAPYIPSPNRAGLVWAFTDCVAKRGPALITEDKALIGCDPVSGRAQEVNLCWEQLCVANGYDVEIAKSADFTIKIIDIAIEDECTALEPTDVTQPCVYFPAGGAAVAITGIRGGGVLGPEASAIAAYGNLECGHTYYWRVKVRECATTQWIRSPWSEARSFTVKAGLPVTTPYYGPQLLAPNNGCLGCPVSPVSFSWSPFKETLKYKFVLASDAAMTQVVTEAEVATTAFEYDGTLDYSTNYFWRVMSLEPAPSDWSATFSFQTEAAPTPVTPVKAPPTPVWVWVVIAIGAILVIVTLVLIFKTRRV